MVEHACSSPMNDKSAKLSDREKLDLETFITRSDLIFRIQVQRDYLKRECFPEYMTAIMRAPDNKTQIRKNLNHSRIHLMVLDYLSATDGMLSGHSHVFSFVGASERLISAKTIC